MGDTIRVQDDSATSPAAIHVDIDTMHHEISPLPNGNFVTLSTEIRTVSGFTTPQCGEPMDQFTGSYRVLADIVVEFVPRTGRIVAQYPLANYLDPLHNPADANICDVLGSNAVELFSDFYGDYHDWTHANAVVLDSKRDALLVSIRNLDVVLALRYHADKDGPAGELLWRFGSSRDFRLVDDGLWPSHRHTVEAEADGSILMYDNGNGHSTSSDAHARSALQQSGPLRHPRRRTTRPVDRNPSLGVSAIDQRHTGLRALRRRTRTYCRTTTSSSTMGLCPPWPVCMPRSSKWIPPTTDTEATSSSTSESADRTPSHTTRSVSSPSTDHAEAPAPASADMHA